MRKAKSFGVRGMSAEERADANPYWGVKVPLGGIPGKNTYQIADEGGRVYTHDDALRNFMLMVYNYMFAGLLLTGVTAYYFYTITVTGNPDEAFQYDTGSGLVPMQVTATEYLTPLGEFLWSAPMNYLICFGPLLLLVSCAPVFRNLDAISSAIIFALVAFLIGISFSGLTLIYTNSSMTSVFFITAGMFAGLSLTGYTTRKDLSGWGGFLWMGFLGLLIAIIVNIFLGSDALRFAICSVGVLVFAGFTMYDTQMIKEAYSDELNENQTHGLAISGALDLYLDFVNLFRFLLFFLGSEEE